MSDEDLYYYIPTAAEQRARDRSRELYDKAVAAAEDEKLDQAIELTRQALEIGRSGADEWHLRFLEGRLADLLIKADRADEARDLLERSLAAGAATRARARNDRERREAEDIPASRGLLQQIYLATDEYDALARFVRTYDREEAATAGPPYFQGATAILGLAARSTALAEGGIRDERPIELAQALATDVGNVRLLHAVQHERGAGAEALGDDDGAIATYSQLVKLGSRHEPTLTRLLILLERAGRVAEALNAARSLASEPLDRELKADLEKRIERLAKKKAPSADAREKRRGPTDDSTFGRLAQKSSSAEDLLGLEASMGRSVRFQDLDRIASQLVSHRLAGHSISEIAGRTRGVRLTGLSILDRQFLDTAFGRKELQARGAWFLPERVSAHLRVLAPANGWNSTTDESADTIFVWSLLGPLYAALHRPHELRELSAGRSASQQEGEWQGVVDLFTSLGIDARLELDVMAYGGGWSRLKAHERGAVQDRLAVALVEWGPSAVRRYRALKTLELIQAFYAKADADGRALRTRVVTAALRPTVIAYFRGDWLAFLDYLGEKPHPGEQIVTALPEATVVVAGSDWIAAAAAQLGVSPEQAAIIGQTLLGGSESPVEARVRALKSYWATFDAIHARQEQGMPSLWGLIEERWDLGQLNSGPSEHNSGLFRQALPAEVLAEIDRLWGGEIVPQWPDKVLSSMSPHLLAADTFGTALTFWHGVALTAWFVCEGPMSRTSIEDMETYYARDLQVLDELGTPVDRAMFRDLLAVKKMLRTRPREDVTRSGVEVAEGISFEISMAMGPDRLVGFDKLCDVITRYRRAWAGQYLEAYLHKRWDAEVRSAATTFSRMSAEANKPPAAKTFARKVEATVDHWFGGDLSSLYTAIGATCPVVVTRPPRVLPLDQFAFVNAFVTEIQEAFRAEVSSKDERATWENNRALSDLARLSVKAVQMREALGLMPSLKEFGAPAFERAQRVRVGDQNYVTEPALAEDPESAYLVFIGAIDRALAKSRMQARVVAQPSVTLPAVAPPAAASLETTPRSAKIDGRQPAAETSEEKRPGLLGRLFGRR